MQQDSKECIEHHKRLTASNHHAYNTKINAIIRSRTRTGSFLETTHLVADILYQDKNVSKLESIDE